MMAMTATSGTSVGFSSSRYECRGADPRLHCRRCQTVRMALGIEILLAAAVLLGLSGLRRPDVSMACHAPFLMRRPDCRPARSRLRACGRVKLPVVLRGYRMADVDEMH